MGRLSMLLAVLTTTRVVIGAENKQQRPQPSPTTEHALVSFTRDIRPLLSAKCFACHGPDEESGQADLRLDKRKSAIDYGALVPGDVKASLVAEQSNQTIQNLSCRRPTLDSASPRIDPKWIEQGADYSPHWSFMPPERSGLPKWPRTIGRLMESIISCSILTRPYRP